MTRTRWRKAVRTCLWGAAFMVFSEVVTANPELLWFADGYAKPEARQAVRILDEAGLDGLEPDDYPVGELRRSIMALPEDQSLDPSDATRLDEQLTSAMTHYLNDLHYGRINPRDLHAKFALMPPDPFDAGEFLRAALADQRLPEAARQAAPAIPLYERLRNALAGYRTLAGNNAWSSPLPPFPGRKLEPGQAYGGLGILRERLIALGDLAPTVEVPKRYQGAIVDAIRAFQERHGLEADGVIGKDTLASLNVSPAMRVRQIEVTLERLRWTPLFSAPRMVAINIPEFMLRAYEIRDGRVSLQASMKVIIGRAMDTETPVFDEDMRFIEFSPYWNVPPSIARGEIVPKLRRDAGYFAKQGFEFVGRDGRVHTALSTNNLDAVLRGDMRIRQRPGLQNALGDIKFIFPNEDHIYLHHTPATQLFKRTRRDFSHGCIRVEDPVALARFVLQNEAEWSEDRILEAMHGGISKTLHLREPVRVLIAYSTAVVKNDGRIHFFDDLYGHDKLLDEALRQHSALIGASH